MNKSLRFPLDIQLFADSGSGDEQSETMKQLLEKIDGLEKRCEKLEADNKEIVALNKALLDKKETSTKKEVEDVNEQAAKDKLKKFIEEE